jgi:hypothetical protein
MNGFAISTASAEAQNAGASKIKTASDPIAAIPEQPDNPARPCPGCHTAKRQLIDGNQRLRTPDRRATILRHWLNNPPADQRNIDDHGYAQIFDTAFARAGLLDRVEFIMIDSEAFS